MKLPEVLDHPAVPPLARQFARFCAGLDPEAGELALLTAAALAARNLQGDTCLDLARLAGRPLLCGPEGECLFQAPSIPRWTDALRAGFVGGPGDYQPLVLDARRLYLHRHWREETAIAAALKARMIPVDTEPDWARARLDAAFGPLDTGAPAYGQRLAVAMALTRRLTIVTGGPGTGKTTTVIRLLALLLEREPGLRIALAAPTGKAAARLAESIVAQIGDLAAVPEAVRARIPRQAATLHRLLGWTPTGFTHHAANRLPVDCLVVDECSMVDQGLMAALLEALPGAARLVLLGDRDQLASVEAGSVLGDLTGRGAALVLSPGRARELEALMGGPLPEALVSPDAPGIADHIAWLRHSYRFAAGGGIGRLAAAVNRADVAAVQDLMESGDAELGWLPSSPGQPPAAVLQWALDHYLPVFQADSADRALARFESARLLTALRKGPWGERALGRDLHAALLRRGLAAGPDERRPYRGLPVLILRNDVETGLFNGDTGIFWPDAAGRLRAWFRRPQGLQGFGPHQLPAWQPAWTLTVHRSQGSEYDQVLLVLPPEASPVVTRELVYTGLTRARRRCTLVCAGDRLLLDIGRRIERDSGLAERLGWPQPA